jgi:glycosyltransferase involved in cell wall biosynthesis
MDKKDAVISIITVCYNCQDTIQKTLESVFSQTYPYIQYIIIDGGSTDKTLSIISTFKDRIDIVISEKDAGIYDAMNKGLRHARGDIIYFLNSGDLLFDKNTVKKIMAVFEDKPEVSLVCGDKIDYGDEPDRYCSMYRNPMTRYFPQAVCHQALFSRKKLFEKIGMFNVHYPVFGDRDWIFRCIFLNNEKMTHIPIPVCYYLTGGGCYVHDALFYRVRTKLLLKYLTNPKIFFLLLKYPREMVLAILLFFYSFMNAIVISLFNKPIIIKWEEHEKKM